MQNEEEFDGYVTKYALTEGIQRMRLKSGFDGIAQPVRRSSFYTLVYHTEGKDWHRTLDSALKCAEQMRKAKLASLRKSIAKMEKIYFVASMKDTSDAE